MHLVCARPLLRATPCSSLRSLLPCRPTLTTHAVTDNASDELPNGLTIEDALSAVRRLDTTPPPPESDELLADWYDQVVRWSPEFIDVIWGTFADFRLFEVVEVPFR